MTRGEKGSRALKNTGKGDPVQVMATLAQIEAAPIGDLFHRNWTCKALEPERTKQASGSDMGTTREGWGRGKVAWERALVPLPPPPVRPRAPEATFHWKVKPSEDYVSGDFYLDGSALDGPSPELMRCGWAFVAVNADGAVIASAYGATPPRGSTTSVVPRPGPCFRPRDRRSPEPAPSSPTARSWCTCCRGEGRRR